MSYGRGGRSPSGSTHYLYVRSKPNRRLPWLSWVGTVVVLAALAVPLGFCLFD